MIPRAQPGEENIDLGAGWYLAVPDEADDDGRKQGFVFRPDGRDSASVEAALGLGHLTGLDETPVPPAVLRELEQYREEYA